MLAASASLWLNQIVAGIAEGGWLFLVAAGLTLVFGVLHVLNFAHGSLYLLGAYFGWAMGSLLGTSVGGFVGDLLIAPLIVAAVGAVIEVGLLRWVYRRELLYQFLLMFGVVYLLTGLTQAIWGVGDYQLTVPGSLLRPLSLGPVTVPLYSVFTFGVAVLACLLMLALLFRSSFGRDVRAVAQDAEMASLLGINVARTRTAVFVIGSYLAGIAGVITAGKGSFGPTDGVGTVILGFVVVIVGGMGSIAGAVVASLIIGIANAIGVIVIPTLSEVIVYAVMAIVLLVRPWGLFGTPMRG